MKDCYDLDVGEWCRKHSGFNEPPSIGTLAAFSHSCRNGPPLMSKDKKGMMIYLQESISKAETTMLESLTNRVLSHSCSRVTCTRVHNLRTRILIKPPSTYELYMLKKGESDKLHESKARLLTLRSRTGSCSVIANT